MAKPQALRHKELENGIPNLSRLVPCLYNLWYRRACLAVLRGRTIQSVDEAWAAYGLAWLRVVPIARIVVEEFFWPRESFFLPEDDCWVIFCFWRRQLTDSLELVTCFVRIQEELGAILPDQINELFANMPFGDFCKAVLTCVPPGVS